MATYINRISSLVNGGSIKTIVSMLVIWSICLWVAGWIATVQIRDCSTFSDSEKSWALAMSIIGIPFPALQVVPIFITQSKNLCGSTAVSAMGRASAPPPPRQRTSGRTRLMRVKP